jgi:DNA-binding Lrp family transcriptional regulator
LLQLDKFEKKILNELLKHALGFRELAKNTRITDPTLASKLRSLREKELVSHDYKDHRKYKVTDFSFEAVFRHHLAEFLVSKHAEDAFTNTPFQFRTLTESPFPFRMLAEDRNIFRPLTKNRFFFEKVNDLSAFVQRYYWVNCQMKRFTKEEVEILDIFNKTLTYLYISVFEWLEKKNKEIFRRLFNVLARRSWKITEDSKNYNLDLVTRDTAEFLVNVLEGTVISPDVDKLRNLLADMLADEKVRMLLDKEARAYRPPKTMLVLPIFGFEAEPVKSFAQVDELLNEISITKKAMYSAEETQDEHGILRSLGALVPSAQAE